MNFVTSKYIQICDWALIEYEYSSMDLSTHNAIKTVGESSAVGIFRITNNITDEYQFANYSFPKGDSRNLGNILEWNLIPINSTQSKWATSNIINDSEFNPGYINNLQNPNELIPITPKFILDDLSNEIISFGNHEVRYDKIRIHILSGYNLEGIDGFILDISFLENSKKKMKVSSAAYLRNNTFQSPVFNPNPIMMGERIYDKYISVSVPSLYQIQNEADSSNTAIFSKLYSHPTIPENTIPGGFLKDSTIYITLSEIKSSDIKNDIEFFNIKQSFIATLLPSDTYSYLGCVIRESKNGNFYEYFPTWQGEFIDDYINTLNAASGSNGLTWTVIHNLKVIEQIGTEFFTTSDLTIPQSSNFTKPSYFRPIILRANEAFSYSLLYTMRLVNNSTGEQVIRMCNITSYNPKSYGFEMKKITIDEGLQPMKVYNKIVNETTSHNSSIVRSENMFTTKYIPQYIIQNSIAVNMTNSIATQFDNIVYGQGKCVLELNKYDNIVKFTILNIKGVGVLPMSLIGMKIFLRFSLDNGQDVDIPSDISESIHPEAGEVVFTILKDISTKILNIKKDKNFYLIAKQDSGSLETVIYSGKFEKFTEGKLVDAEMSKPLQILFQEKQNELDNAIILTNEKQSILDEEIKKYKQLQAEFVNKIAEYQKLIDKIKNPSLSSITSENNSYKEQLLSSSRNGSINPIKLVVPASQKPQEQKLSIEQIVKDTDANLTKNSSTSINENQYNTQKPNRGNQGNTQKPNRGNDETTGNTQKPARDAN